MTSGPPDQHFQAARLNRLLEEPIGAQLVHRFDGRLDVSVGCEHDGGRHVGGLLQTLQESETVQSWHVQVGEDHVGRKVSQLAQRLVAVGGGFRGHAPGGNHGRQATPLAGLVIYYENFYGLIQKIWSFGGGAPYLFYDDGAPFGGWLASRLKWAGRFRPFGMAGRAGPILHKDVSIR